MRSNRHSLDFLEAELVYEALIHMEQFLQKEIIEERAQLEQDYADAIEKDLATYRLLKKKIQYMMGPTKQRHMWLDELRKLVNDDYREAGKHTNMYEYWGIKKGAKH
jgi:hypothetical protein